jgi:Tol biopolymer transport system component
MVKMITSSLLMKHYKFLLIKQIHIFCFFLFICLTSCARYRPTLLINYTQEGKEISIRKLVDGASPSWSPDGRKIVFQRDGLLILDLTTKEETRFTQAGTSPSWSPDGKKIAYVNNGIRVWDSETDTHRQLSKSGNNPCWFPKGDSLVFNHNGIWRINIDGSDKIKLLDMGIPLSFSPDGSSLLVEVWEPDHVLFKLATFGISTLELNHLVEGTKGSFAPDGYSIVYSSEGIWIYSIISKDSTGIVLSGYDPKWSPDGDNIIFHTRGFLWLVNSPYKSVKPKNGFK